MRLIESMTWLHVLIISAIGGVIVAAVVHFTRPGIFVADTTVLLSDRPDALAAVTAGEPEAGASLERLKAIAISRTVREQVIDALDLQNRLNTDKAELINRLVKITSIRDIGEDGMVIAVTLRGYADPRFAFFNFPIGFADARQLSADIANSYVAQLEDYLRQTNVASAREGREFLEKRYNELRDELDDIEDRLEGLRAQYELLDPDANAARVSDRIRVLEQARADAIAEADATASSLAAAEQQLEATEVRRISSSVESRNPLIASLEQELTRLRVDLATELAQGKTREHRDVQQIQASIDSTEAQIAELQETVVREVGEQPNPLHDEAVRRVVDLRVQLAGARARSSENSALLAQARSEMAQMPAVAREYVAIQRDQQVRADQLVAVEQALWQARLQEARGEVEAPFRVLDAATPPVERRGPPTLMAGLIGFVALMLLQGLLIIDRRWFGG